MTCIKQTISHKFEIQYFDVQDLIITSLTKKII